VAYSELYDSILSAKPYTVRDVATTWRNFAEALRSASSSTQSTSNNVTAQDGQPYQNFGARAAPIASWLNGVSGNADQVAAGLSNASTTARSAQMTAAEENISFGQDVDRILGPEDALSVGRSNAINRRQEQATAVMQEQIRVMSDAYNAFQPGTVGAAPTTNGGGSTTANVGSGNASGSTGAGGSGGGSAGLVSGGAGSGGADGNTIRPVGDPAGPQTANPIANGGATSDFPDSSVIGNDGGDFAGFVRDPRTGFLINPATGQEFDPISGRWIDPLTGRPFGDVVHQAARLEGLTGGTTGGLFGNGPGTVGLTPTLPGGGGGGGPSSILPGMFGGVFPPSTSPNNPAARQLQQSALDRMAAKAGAARQLALSEAAQGGRPYLPPTQAGGGALPSGRRSLARVRMMGEPESTWTGRNGRTGSGAGSNGSGQRLMPGGGGGMPVGGGQSSRKQQKSRKEAFPGGDGEGRLIDESDNGSDVGKAALIGAGTVGAVGIAGAALSRGLGGGGGGAGVAPLIPPNGGVAGGTTAGGRGRTGGSGVSGQPGAGSGRAAAGGAAARRPYLPPMQAGQAGEKDSRKRQRPDWLVEDDIWSAGTSAGPAVLGED
jgi:hypothetical protein